MLQLKFVAGGSADCPLLRISGDDLGVCVQLKEAFERLAEGRLNEICLSELPGIEAKDGCRLNACIAGRNRGVVRFVDSDRFDWHMTAAGWDNNAGLIEPFCERQNLAHFQWLDSPSDIRVLFSPSGDW